MYLTTSGDLLNIILALSILLVTVFLCWFLYYLIVIVRTFAQTVEDFQKRLQLIDETIHLIREKLESTSTYLGLLVDVVKEGLRWARDRHDEPMFKKKGLKK